MMKRRREDKTDTCVPSRMPSYSRSALPLHSRSPDSGGESVFVQVGPDFQTIHITVTNYGTIVATKIW